MPVHWQILKDAGCHLGGGLIRGEHPAAADARLAMQSHAEFHLVLGDVENRAPGSWNRARRQGNAHASAVLVRHFGGGGHFLEVGAPLRAGARCR